MPSFDIVSRVDVQEIDNAVNVTRKAILSRYDFRNSKTEITLDKKEKKIHVTTEDDMKLRAVQDSLIENLVKRKVDRKFLEPKPAEPAAHGMIQRELAIKEGVDSDTARSIVKMIKDRRSAGSHSTAARKPAADSAAVHQHAALSRGARTARSAIWKK
jgi:uncharacterized protein YajQ (UPF0234 family)